MSKTTTNTLPEIESERLEKAPHVLTQFIDMINGKCQFNPTQKKQNWKHVSECIYCQTFLGIYLVKAIEYNKAHGFNEVLEQKLLSRLTRIMHKAFEEDIPTYVEVLIEYNEEEASNRFPHLAVHMRECLTCHTAMQDLQSWLGQAIEAGLITPAKLDSHK